MPKKETGADVYLADLYNQNSQALLARIRAAGEQITAELRQTLFGLIETATGAEHETTETLKAWASEVNADGLAEWVGNNWGKVYEDELEAALVACWSDKPDPRPVPFILNFEDLARGNKPGKILTGSDVQRVLDVGIIPGKAFMTIKRGEPLPPVPDTWPTGSHVCALDGFKAMLAARAWLSLSTAPTKTKDRPKGWLYVLALYWINARAADISERIQRQSEAAALAAAPAVYVKSRKYGRLPKVTAGLSWAFGGPGVELSSVTVDGRTYAPAPDLAIVSRSALVPASYSLLPADHEKRPHQTLLPIDLDGADEAPPLPVALADATQYALAPAAGKLGLLVLAAAHDGKGKLHRTSLRELTQDINPDATHLVRSHFETVCRGLVQLDGLRLVLPNGMAYRVFECPVPWRELKPVEYDAPLFVGLTRTFERTLTSIQQAAGKSYRGYFLFDLTGAMKLPTRRPGLVRQYIRATAYWNSYWKPGTNGEKDPGRIPEVETERWAALTNYLTPTAAEYLRTKRKGSGDRRRLSDSIRDTLADAEALAEYGLVNIARADRRAVRLLPPPEYLEAWHQSRKGAHKLPGNAPEQ